jgi:long-chain acyl-CoA synthetase
VKISEDGEVLVKGSTLMKSYYLKTDNGIDKRGWFHTRDEGLILNGKYLKIITRKDDIFKTISGKFIYPEIIESKLKKSPYIRNVLVYGENRNYLVALIVPDFVDLKKNISQPGSENSDERKIQKHQELKNIYQEILEKYNYESNASDTEKVKNFIILNDKWSVETGELTSSYKLKRKSIINKYKKLIDSIYNNEKIPGKKYKLI